MGHGALGLLLSSCLLSKSLGLYELSFHYLQKGEDKIHSSLWEE